MKKYAVISLVVIMLALLVVPAFAKGPTQNSGTGIGTCTSAQDLSGTGMQNSLGSGSQYESRMSSHHGFRVSTPYDLSGTIAALDEYNRTVTISVICGSRMEYPYIAQDVTLVTTDATRFLLRSEDGTAIPITFGDLAVGQDVSSHITLVDGVFTAIRITSDALLSCQQ